MNKKNRKNQSKSRFIIANLLAFECQGYNETRLELHAISKSSTGTSISDLNVHKEHFHLFLSARKLWMRVKESTKYFYVGCWG